MRSVIVLIVLGGICLAHVAYGQGQGFGRKKEVVPAIRSDIKYIQCQFCRIAARHLHRSVADLRKDVPSWKRVTENDIQEHLEVACNTDKIEGEWLLKLDVQERQDELVLTEMSKVRHQAYSSQFLRTHAASDVSLMLEIGMVGGWSPHFSVLGQHATCCS